MAGQVHKDVGPCGRCEGSADIIVPMSTGRLSQEIEIFRRSIQQVIHKSGIIRVLNDMLEKEQPQYKGGERR